MKKRSAILFLLISLAFVNNFTFCFGDAGSCGIPSFEISAWETESGQANAISDSEVVQEPKIQYDYPLEIPNEDEDFDGEQKSKISQFVSFLKSKLPSREHAAVFLKRAVALGLITAGVAASIYALVKVAKNVNEIVADVKRFAGNIAKIAIVASVLSFWIKNQS